MPDDQSPHSAFVQGLVDLGVDPGVAGGAISYASQNESGGDPGAVNPTSGASFYMQWLGPRKQALIDQYGPNPSISDQVAFMKSELQGPENLTLSRLLTASPGDHMAGYSTWGRSYERPGPLALMKAGVLGPTGQASPGLNIGSQADLSGVRGNALGALGGSNQSAPSPINVTLGGGGASGAAGGFDSPWARLMQISMIQQLTSRGTHQFQPIDYDPWKVAAAAGTPRR